MCCYRDEVGVPCRYACVEVVETYNHVHSVYTVTPEINAWLK